MQKIAPCLWFDNNAEEAVNFYMSVFKNSKIKYFSRYGDFGGMPKGTVLAIWFQLEGQDFMALNGGPYYSFTPAISLMVNCQTQEELDDIWNKLSADPASEQCGWLKDKFGLSWQIVPEQVAEWIGSEDPTVSNRVMQEVVNMKKLDIKRLQEAAKE